MIEWGKVQTNVVSALFVALIGSAVAVMWNGATTVDEKVDDAVATVARHQESLKRQADHLEATQVSLSNQAAYLEEMVEVLQEELRQQKARDNEIIEELRRMLEESTVKKGGILGLGAKEEPAFVTRLRPVEVPDEDFIQRKLPELNVQQMAPVVFPVPRDSR